MSLMACIFGILDSISVGESPTLWLVLLGISLMMGTSLIILFMVFCKLNPKVWDKDA